MPTDGRDIDDWLGGTGEIDWGAGTPSASRRPERVDERASRATNARRGGEAQREAEHPDEATIRRRRAIGLIALLVIVGGVIVIAVVAFGGGSSESPATTAKPPATTPATTTPATTTPATHDDPATTTPATTTPTTTSPPAASSPLTVDVPAGEKLQRGSSGDTVTQLQTGLTALALDPGPADGDFGPLTEAAVIEFQRSKGLATDGIVGVNTTRELNAALAGLPAASSSG